MIIFLPAIIQFGIWIYIPRNRYSAFAAWWFCSNGGFYLIGSIIKSNSLKLLPLLLLLLGLSFHTIDYLGQEKKFFPEYKQKVIPVPNLKTFKTKAGLEIFTPVSGQNQCWDSNIPCTPYHNENLKQFDENNLGSGFYLNHVD